MTGSKATHHSMATHQQERSVRWIETDASGFTTIPSYIRMMEETEYSFLRSRGLCVVLHDDKGVFGFPRLSTNIEVQNPARFGDVLTIKLDLQVADGKEIYYGFNIFDDQNTLAVAGQFKVATCRFPRGDWPYAILTPEFVIEKLTGETTNE